MKHITPLLYMLLAMLWACTSKSDDCREFAASWTAECPVVLTDDITATSLDYSGGKFTLNISLGKDAPVSATALAKIDDEYAYRLTSFDNYMGREIGTQAFVKGLVAASPQLAQMIDSVSVLTASPESNQGYLPLVFNISDGMSELQCTYNEEWEHISEYEWLNAIMPVEMCNFQSGISPLPPLNALVRVAGSPSVDPDGTLVIECYYNAFPSDTEDGRPLSITDIRGNYFSSDILENYIAELAEESADAARFFNACKRHGVDVKFRVTGSKDGIDRDLASPKLIKTYDSCGGNDSITIRL